jgi:CDP-diacylglycerol pyrophosphatase
LLLLLLLLCTTTLLTIQLSKPVRKAGNPNAIWNIVHNQCVPSMEKNNDPKPCAAVNITNGVDKGFALLKDIKPGQQFLLIPTRQIAGIESDSLLEPDAVNYFDAAWSVRSFVEQNAPGTLTRSDYAMAINSMFSRSQNQLHIHVDCIRQDVRDALRQNESAIKFDWAPLNVPLAGRTYMVMRVNGSELGSNNPVKLMANSLTGASTNMGAHTLIVVGATFSDGTEGFILLADQANRFIGNRGHGEDVEDHSCAVATPRPTH